MAALGSVWPWTTVARRFWHSSLLAPPSRSALTAVLPGPRLHGVASGVDFDLDLFPEGPVIIGRALFSEGVGAVVSRQHIRITGNGSSWGAWDVSSFGTQLEAFGATRRLPTSEAEAVQIYDGDKLIITADVFLVAAGLGPRPPPSTSPLCPIGPTQACSPPRGHRVHYGGPGRHCRGPGCGGGD